MSLYKRGDTWWIRITHQGKQIRQSTETSDKTAAKKLHDKFVANLWNVTHFQTMPQHTWLDAVVRWLEESQHKRSLCDDRMHFRWLDPHLKEMALSDITREQIESIAKIKESTGVQPSSVNRMLALIRATLRKAEREWGWIERAPLVRMRKENKGRIRWLSYREAHELLAELPPHLSDMAAFTLATGLRRANVTGLQWCDVNLDMRHALIHPDQAKSKKAIPVPLNADAIAILEKQMGKHAHYVFSYQGARITQCSTKAWRKALQRVGIANFRWHDLRHTWASWHVQNGTTLQELQLLGGWSSFDIVLRYAHLSSAHLKNAAERIISTKLAQSDFGAAGRIL